MEMKLIRKGSAKDIYRVDKNTIAFRCTPYFSVFDVGRSGQEIPGKAEAICACAVKSFEIANAIGIPTHFVEQIDPTTIIVKEASIITDHFLTAEDENYVIPIEWISRLRVAGSIYRKFKSKEKGPEDYGLPAGKVPKEGTPFPYPVHNITTKFEKIDRDLNEDEAYTMSGITKKDANEYWSMIDRLNGAISLRLYEVGFVNLDGKMECLMGLNRKKMIGDIFGTPDEDRPCSLVDIQEGNVVHYSKEFIRQLFMSNGYYEQLIKARALGQDDPSIPMLSDEDVREASRRYAAVAEAYTGNRLEFSG